MTPYQKARKLIIDSIYPDGVPLEEGCEIMISHWKYPVKISTEISKDSDGDEYFYVCFGAVTEKIYLKPKEHETKILEILGREPSLPEVLRAIQTIGSYTALRIDSYGRMYQGNGFEWTDTDVRYNLNTPLLKDQSQEVHEWIISVLIK